jgi:SNF2 family DNA or RNA helicase
MDSKQYDGSVTLINNSQWAISGKPHVLFRAEKAIMNARRKDGSVVVPATGEGATDIFWFAQRYRLEIKEPRRLRGDAASFAIAHGQAERILSGNFGTTVAGFRHGKKPRDYQLQAAQLWQSVKGLLVADQLGLGKTISAATALMDKRLRPAMIVAPTNLTDQWQDVFHEFFTGVRTHIIKQNNHYDLPKYRKCEKCNVWSMQKLKHGKPEHLGLCRKCQRTVTGECADADVFIISYHKLHSWADILGPVCNSVVFDEAHELRRQDSRKYEAAHRLTRMVDWRLGLSATPVSNLGGELFNILDCLQPGALGTKSDFRKTWCYSTQEHGKEPALTDPAAFGEYLRSQHLMIRRTRAEVGRELPEHTRILHKIDADPSAITKIAGKAGDLARLILSKSNVQGQQLTAAGQLESLVRQTTGIAKAPYVAAYVDMILQQGTPVVLFAWHRAVWEILLRDLRDHNPLMYTGSETNDRKREMKDRFMVGDSNLLMVSLRSGAGLDGLQHRCNTGVFAELDWSPAIMEQCAGRYHRDGQSLHSQSHYLVSDFGLDPAMVQTLGIKRAQSAGILQSGDEETISKQSSNYVKELAESFIRGTYKH